MPIGAAGENFEILGLFLPDFETFFLIFIKKIATFTDIRKKNGKLVDFWEKILRSKNKINFKNIFKSYF